MSNYFTFDHKAFEEAIERAVRKALAKERTSTDSPSERGIMGVQDAAEYLGKAITTIYKLTSKRQIPHHKRGRKLYFLKEELDQWILDGRVKTSAELREEVFTNISNNKKRRGR